MSPQRTLAETGRAWISSRVRWCLRFTTLWYQKTISDENKQMKDLTPETSRDCRCAPGARTAGSPSTRAARAHRGRMRTGRSFRGCGTRPAGSDSPRLSRNTPHASGNRGRITTEKWNSMGAKQAHREMLPAPCLQHSPNCGEGATHSFARQGPPRHNHRSPGCWAFLAQARTVRAKRVPQPAEGMPRASPANYEHSGKKTQGWEIVVCPPFPITKPPTGGK